MKEATGELNLSVVIITAVGILSAVFFSLIWPNLKANFDKKSKCDKAICEPCTSGHSCKQVSCYLKGDEGAKFNCPYKG